VNEHSPEEITEALDELKTYREMRAYFRYSIIFLFFLAIVIAAISYLLSTIAVNRAIKNTATISELCQSNNDFRMRQVSLWKFVLSFPPPSGETPQDKAARLRENDNFQSYVSRVFAPRNCSRITGGEP
jgi:hypothetical protein